MATEDWRRVVLGAIDWGIVGAIATVVAAAFALITLWYTARTDRRAVDLNRRAQAAQVSVSASETGYQYEAEVHAPFKATIRNDSDQPIYQVTLALLPIKWLKSSKPMETAGWLTIQPHDIGEDTMSTMEGPVEIVNGIPAPPPMRLAFRDSAGVHWVRYPDGQLDEVKRHWWQRGQRTFVR